MILHQIQDRMQFESMAVKKSKRFLAGLAVIVLIFSFAVPTSAKVPKAPEPKGITRLIPGGMTFGVKFFTEGAIVVGTTGVETSSGVVSPAKDAGLKAGDVIIRAGGSEFESARELISLISGSGGKPIIVAFIRDGNEQTATITPARDLESGEFKMGALVRDSTAGIGTVTFIDPDTLDFGGLGHGIYDAETSLLLPLGKGAVVDVDVTQVVKSEVNSPGQLHGNFSRTQIGFLWDNSDEGVFGRFQKMPETDYQAIPVGTKADVQEDKATLLTSLESGEIEEYEIEILHIYSASGSTKNFLVEITDQRLLDQTGGIVQGMSGSPIIQNGRLIGAVTHVLVNSPNQGYGIFIENMLDTAFDVSNQTTQTPIAA